MSIQAGVLGYTSKNLGDDMQLLATAALLNRVSSIYDRDLIHEQLHHPQTVCIFNSWLKLGDLKKSPSEHIVPIFHGTHIGRRDLLKGQWLDYFKRHAPIGCRDQATVDLLTSAGVEAFLSGCLTLFLGRNVEIFDEEDRYGTIVVDVDDDFLDTHFCREDWVSADFVTMNNQDLRHRPFSRLKAASDILRAVSSAQMVITRRLHVGSPARSLHTPTVLIPDQNISRARSRFSGLERALPFTFQSDIQPDMTRCASDMALSLVLPDAEIDTAYSNLRSRLRAMGLLSDKKTTWDYPEQQLFRFNMAGLSHGCIYARCGTAEQAMPITRIENSLVEAGIPGFLGCEKFDLEFFVEGADGSRNTILPLRAA